MNGKGRRPRFAADRALGCLVLHPEVDKAAIYPPILSLKFLSNPAAPFRRFASSGRPQTVPNRASLGRCDDLNFTSRLSSLFSHRNFQLNRNAIDFPASRLSELSA